MYIVVVTSQIRDTVIESNSLRLLVSPSIHIDAESEYFIKRF